MIFDSLSVISGTPSSPIILERRQTSLHPDLSNLQQNNPGPLQNCDAHTHAVYPACSALPARHACYQTTLLIAETSCVSAAAPV